MATETLERPKMERPLPDNGGPPTRLRGVNAPGRKVVFGKPQAQVGHRIVLYGPGGVGKTSLADLAPGPVVSFDLDDSLGVLQPQHTQRVTGVEDWQQLRDTLKADGWEGVSTLVIDSITRAEELAVAWTLRHTPKDDKGTLARSVEDYGFGKGYGHVFDAFLPLLADLDLHVKAGRNVILIAHECVTRVPNPEGDDWIRYEPRLQDPNSGKGSIRLRLKEWADHLFYLGYDVSVDREGKGRGSGTRTLYPVERPYFMAKSRTLRDPLVIVEGDTTLWDTLFAATNEGSE